jgi:DNA-binding CsgD family transcriptional regulator
MADVVGRGAELAAVDAFLEAPDATVMLIEGPAGIGKTTMWSASLERARAAGRRVVMTQPVEAEAGIAYCGLGDLVGDLFDELGDGLPEPQRHAIAVALMREAPGRDAVVVPAIATGVLGLLRDASATTPLLLAVDDLQWLDVSTASVLRYVLRRTRGGQTRLLATARETSHPSPLAGDDARRLALSPLDLDALAAVVAGRVGHPLPRPVLRAIERMAAGNVFVALELAQTAGADGMSPPQAAHVLTPDQVSALVGDRLSSLPPRTQDALAVVAAMARPQASLVEDAIDEDLLDPAFRRGVLLEAGEEVRFAHPLLAAAALRGATPHRRRAIHRALATLATEPEERAHHLAAATTRPSTEVAEALDDAAASAERRGAPAAAAWHAEQAARLTPAASPARRAARLVLAGDCHERAGDAARALALFRRACEAAPAGPARAQAMCRIGSHEHTSLPDCVRLCTAALEECGDERPVRIECLLLLVLGSEIQCRLDDARRFAAQVLELVDADTPEGLHVWALAVLGDLQSKTAPGGGRDVLREAMAIEGDRSLPNPDLSPTTCLGRALAWADELDDARELLRRSYDRALAMGDEAGVSDVGGYLALLECRAGDLVRARAYAEESLAICEQGAEQDQNLGGALYHRAWVAAHEGDAALARELSGRGLAIAEAIGDRAYATHHHRVLGLLELSLGDPVAALAHLEPLPAQLAAFGINEPGVQPCRPEVIEALIATGQRAEAEAHLAQWEAFGDEHDRPAALCTAARARGLLAADAGDHEAAIAHLERALELHQRLPVPLELGRTLLALGMIRRRAKQRRAARDALDAAEGVFATMGASIWARRARDERARISGRGPRRSDELTATERQIADLVARGRTNRQVAAELYLTVRTVEANLTRIYAKLGVRSRTEMVARRQDGDRAG